MSEEVKKLRLLPKSKKIGGRLHLAGTGSLNASIMFVGPCVLEEEMLKMAESRMAYDAAIGLYQKSMAMITLAAKVPGR